MARPLDRETVESVYRRYGAQVQRCCRRILRDPSEAADAAQEVFVKLFTHGGDFHAESEWMSWLYRTSTNLCLNRLRDSKNRRRLLEEHGDQVKPTSPIANPAMVADRLILRSLLDEEDAVTRQIVVCYYLHEMSQPEIARLVRLSRVSVNKRLQRFRKRALEAT